MRYVVPGLLGVCLSAGIILFGAVELHYASVMYGLAGLLALIWAAKVFFDKTPLWKPSPMHWPVLGFVIYTFIHYFASPYEYLSRLELFQVCLYALVYFIAANNVNRGRDRAIVLGILLVLGTLEAMYGIWQAYTKTDAVLHLTRPTAYSSRASGTYVCPNHLAGMLEMILGFALARLALYRPSERDSIETQVLSKVMLVYVVLAIMIGIVFSFSRAGWFSTTIGLIVFVVWARVGKRVAWQRLAVGAAGVLVFALLIFSVPQARQYLDLTLTSRDNQSTGLRDASLNNRTPLWAASWRIIKDHPIFGTGAATWQWVHPKYREPQMQFSLDYAHNDILQMTADYGIVGFCIIAAALGCFYWQARRLTASSITSEQRTFVVGAAVAISILLVHSWFDFNLHIPANGLLFATILGLVAGMQVPEGPWSARPLRPALRYGLGVCLIAAIAAGVCFVLPAARAVQYAEIGNQHKQWLQWDEAINYFEASIACDPKYIRPRTKIGDIYMVQARFRVGEDKRTEQFELAREAVKHYEAAFNLNRSRGDVLAKLADAYELAGESKKAEKAFQDAIALDPNNTAIRSQHALFLRRQGSEREALQAFQAIEKIRANMISYWNLTELRETVRPD
jgi:O-antigen ligase